MPKKTTQKPGPMHEPSLLDPEPSVLTIGALTSQNVAYDNDDNVICQSSEKAAGVITLTKDKSNKGSSNTFYIMVNTVHIPKKLFVLGDNIQVTAEGVLL